MDEAKILRIIDSNINRTKEALRVLEDVARFYFDNETLCSQIACIRHTAGSKEDIALIQKHGKLLGARDSAGDAGRHVIKSDEFKREDIADIVRANFRRAQESLRVLEECIKLIEPSVAASYKNLRYEVYSLEKDYPVVL